MVSAIRFRELFKKVSLLWSVFWSKNREKILKAALFIVRSYEWTFRLHSDLLNVLYNCNKGRGDLYSSAHS